MPSWRLPEAAFFRQNDFNHLDLNTSTVVAGDFTGDEREDIAVYRQDTTEIGIWGVSQISVPPAISRMRSVPVAFHNSQTPVNPVLVPLNVDTDSPVLRYDAGEYRLVFSEPVLLAALAAAPSKAGIRPLRQHRVDPVSVGQGSGETEVTLEVEEEWSPGGALELGFTLDMEITGGGVLGGVSVGASTASTFRVTSGQATTYTGTVGAIDAADFAAHRYSFGLFTYVHRDPFSVREFEVLNYWIE